MCLKRGSLEVMSLPALGQLDRQTGLAVALPGAGPACWGGQCRPGGGRHVEESAARAADFGEGGGGTSKRQLAHFNLKE